MSVKPYCTKRVLFLLISLVLIAILAYQSLSIVNQQDRGVVLRNGQILRVVAPGYAWKIPLIDEVIHVSMQRNLIRYTTFKAYTKDLDMMELELSLIWRVDPSKLAEMHTNYGDLQTIENLLILPNVNEQMRLVLSRYGTEQALRNREQLIKNFSIAIKNAIHGAILIDVVHVGNVHMRSIHLD